MKSLKHPRRKDASIPQSLYVFDIFPDGSCFITGEAHAPDFDTGTEFVIIPLE